MTPIERFQDIAPLSISVHLLFSRSYGADGSGVQSTIGSSERTTLVGPYHHNDVASHCSRRNKVASSTSHAYFQRIRVYQISSISSSPGKRNEVVLGGRGADSRLRRGSFETADMPAQCSVPRSCCSHMIYTWSQRRGVSTTPRSQTSTIHLFGIFCLRSVRLRLN